MEITSPSGRVYNWSKDTPPTDADMKALVEFDAKQGGASAPAPQPTAPVVQPRSLSQRIRESSLVEGMIGPTDEQLAAYAAEKNRLPTVAELDQKSQEPTAPTASGDGLLDTIKGSIQSMPAFAQGMNRTVYDMVTKNAEPIADAGSVMGAQATGQMFGSSLGPVGTMVGGAVLGGLDSAAIQVKNKSVHGTPISYGTIASDTLSGLAPGTAIAKGFANFAKRSLVNAALNAGSVTLQSEIDHKTLPTGAQLAIAAGFGVGGTGLQKYLDMGANKTAQQYTYNKAMGLPDLEAWQRAREVGYVFPATVLDKRAQGIRGKLANLIEDTGGKAGSAQDMQVVNVAITNELASKGLGLPNSNPAVVQKTLAMLKDEANIPYDKVATQAEQAAAELAALKKPAFLIQDPHELAIHNANPDLVKKQADLEIKAGANLDAWKKANTNLKDLQYAQATTGKVLYSDIEDAIKAVDTAHDKLIAGVKAMGGDELASDLMKARTKHAQIAAVEDSLASEGQVSANDMSKQGGLTGNFKLIKETNDKFGKYLKDQAAISTPASGKITAALVGGGLGTALGAVTGGPMHASALGGLGLAVPALLKRPALSIQGTNAYQNFMTRPYYGVNQADMAANLAKYAAMQAGRKQQ
jgi:hypothetical protein